VGGGGNIFCSVGIEGLREAGDLDHGFLVKIVVVGVPGGDAFFLLGRTRPGQKWGVPIIGNFPTRGVFSPVPKLVYVSIRIMSGGVGGKSVIGMAG